MIDGLLFALALGCSVLAGYGMAPVKRRNWIYILGFPRITVIALYVILDIEYPRRGLIRLSEYDRVLVELRESVK